MMKVCDGECDQCLFSNKKIVSSARVKSIVRNCKAKQTHFMCHKEKDVVCGGFYRTMGEVSQMIRIAERLKFIEFVKPK